LNLGREAYGKGAVDLEDLTETLSYPGFLRLARRYPRVGATEVLRSFSKSAFVRAAQRLVPKIRADDLVPAPAGIRAQAVTLDGRLLDDFVFHQSDYVLSVVNAPSPAATASLRLGQEVARRALLLRA
jgi:L-2-hydroxyglutarate oxidase